MNDFLSNLIQRTLQPEPAVQPRLASRFEAAPPREEAGPPSLVEEDTEREALPLARPRGTQARLARPVDEEDPAGPADTPPPQTRQRRAARHVAPPEDVLDPPPVSPHPTIRDNQADRAPVQRPVIDAAPPPPSREDAPAHPPQTPGTLPIGEQPAGAGAGIEPALRFAPPSAPASRELLPGDERSEPHAPAPVIRVSIGRVDVRATVAPAQPKGSRAQAPAGSKILSLDEYLSRRAKGDRA